MRRGRGSNGHSISCQQLSTSPALLLEINGKSRRKYGAYFSLHLIVLSLPSYCTKLKGADRNRHLVVSSIFPLEYPNLHKHTSTYVSDFHIPLLGLIPSCSEIQFISLCKWAAIMQITPGYDLHSLSLKLLKKTMLSVRAERFMQLICSDFKGRAWYIGEAGERMKQ